MNVLKGTYKGIFFIALSALFFALNSVFAKIVIQNSDYQGIVLAFVRFIVGFVIFSMYVVIKKKNLKPNNMKLIILRAIFNTLTIIFFFISIQFTTITNANMLNMTYPVFVFLIAPYMNKEKIRKIYYSFLVSTMVGYYLIVFPDFNCINKGDVAGLMAGIMAAFAVTFLREARKHDESYLIIFYLMLIGSVITFIMILPNLEIPTPMIACYMLLSALMGVLGQLFITIGYRYVDPATGALVASSRIIFGVILGVSLFSEILSLRIIIGGILIMISLVGVSGILDKYLHDQEEAL